MIGLPFSVRSMNSDANSDRADAQIANAEAKQHVSMRIE
jgi:hypothetical protein